MYKGASRFLQHHTEHAKEPSLEKKAQQGIPRKLRHALKSQQLIKGSLSDEVKGGYTVIISGYRAFCPHSEMYPRPLTQADLSKLYREPVEFLVIEIGLQSVIISRKRAVQIRAWEQARHAFSDGGLLTGTVKDIPAYGAFIDLGGIDGLLHISKIKDGWIDDIRTSLKKGQLVKVAVAHIDESRKRISLSLPHN
jgi:small subunit ribosomal protein S1